MLSDSNSILFALATKKLALKIIEPRHTPDGEPHVCLIWTPELPKSAIYLLGRH